GDRPLRRPRAVDQGDVCAAVGVAAVGVGQASRLSRSATADKRDACPTNGYNPLMDAPAAPLDEQLARFRLTSFRTGQREVIEAVLAGHDCLCIMPTGGGRSLGHR